MVWTCMARGMKAKFPTTLLPVPIEEADLVGPRVDVNSNNLDCGHLGYYTV
jgi:hypothetical protein